MDAKVANVAEKVVLDTLQIRELIPHRYPMMLIDRIIDLVPGESAVGIKCVTANEEFFQGHFPNQPVMPGVLIVEALAQTAVITVIKSLPPQVNRIVYLMTIDMARFRKPVIPGDRIELRVFKQKQRGPVWKFRGEAWVDGELRAESECTAMNVEDPGPGGMAQAG
ncbi:MAG: 3-hydroxyacyl-ACP dehydratase FabZ [Bdellovibrionales bacterium]